MPAYIIRTTARPIYLIRQIVLSVGLQGSEDEGSDAREAKET